MPHLGFESHPGGSDLTLHGPLGVPRVRTTAEEETISPEGFEIHFDAGLPGFPGAHHFLLSPRGGAEGPFYELRSLDDPLLRFVVVRPEQFFPTFAAHINRALAARLGLEMPGEASIYAIVRLGQTPLDATANLLGPLVVDRRTMLAVQLVLDGPSECVRTPLWQTAAARAGRRGRTPSVRNIDN